MENKGPDKFYNEPNEPMTCPESTPQNCTHINPKPGFAMGNNNSKDQEESFLPELEEECPLRAEDYSFPGPAEVDFSGTDNFSIGQQPSSWENGVFTQGQVGGTPVNFLVDTGAACTVISLAVFEKIPIHRRSSLIQTKIKLTGVGGTVLNVVGIAEMTLVFGGVPIVHEVLVVDIPLDAILGQDILLPYQCKLDLSGLTLKLKGTTLSCWVPGDNAITCRVVIKEEVSIPSWSEKMVPVDIINAGFLAAFGFVQPSPEVIVNKEILMVAGVVSTRSEVVHVRIVNFSDSDVTLHPKQNLGWCESFYEQTSPHTTAEAAALRVLNNASMELTECLKKLVEDRPPEMTEDEKEKWAELLRHYQNIFAQSKADLGRTSVIKHRINTGAALPIRKPARRLPLGKRKTEQEEIQAMLERGVIQPSTSPWAAPIVLVTKKDQSTRFCVDESED